MTTDTELRQPAPSGTDLPPRAALSAVVSSAVEGRALLTHPFYQRWEAGHLAPEELAEYAVHYRAFEAALPAVLGAVAERLVTEGKPDVAALVASNLADELGVPEPHLALFDRFAQAMGADTGRRAGPAAEALVGTYRGLVDEGPDMALAGLAAYETQAAAIAASKAEGLRRFYGVEAPATEFWDVHATMDADHGDWTVDALTGCGANRAGAFRGARRAADAWWAFLDEREAEAPTSARLGSHH